jgi:8-oxo-dGTP diphosphatase
VVGRPLRPEAQLTVGTRGAAAALLLADDHRILIVKPTYKRGWGLPGGVIEATESPRTACIRELTEELGITPALGSLIAVDWIPPRLGRDASNIFVFTGRISNDQVPDIRLPPTELSEHRFVEPRDLADFLPSHVACRVEACLRAQYLAYLEFGHEAIHPRACRTCHPPEQLQERCQDGT